jgi:hypothetical protein
MWNMKHTCSVVLLAATAGAAAACSNNSEPTPASPSLSGAGGALPTVPSPTAVNSEPPPPSPLLTSGPGSASDSPAEVCLPQGARDYLSQLRCPNGAVISVQARVNVGPRNDPPDDLSDSEWEKMKDSNQALAAGEIDYHIVDRFTVRCAGVDYSVYVDIYHCAG